MERIEFNNSDGLTLRGILQKGTTNQLIIMCHGFRSNRHSTGRFDRFAARFLNEGYSVLRFDFGGCGESQDRPLTLAGEVKDLKAAIQFGISIGYEEFALYGHSLGARVCLEAFNPIYVKTLLLTGAGTGPVKYDWTEEFNQEQLNELEKTGFLTQTVEDSFRETITISKQMLRDFEEMDQKKTLSAITVPTLIVHGDQGEESILVPLTKQGMQWLPAGSKLEVIPGAHHSFMDHLDHVEDLLTNWVNKHLKS